ncbi:MAG: dissimilatory-type sulfite reductase subunit beta [Thermoplasmata archaeon]
MSAPVQRLKKTLPVPYTKYLPDAISRNVGHWTERKFHGAGIIEHISDTGDHLFTVKIGGPPNARFSTATLRKFAEITDSEGSRALRFTRSGNVELFAESLESALRVKKAVEELGYFVGGWGNTLWSIQSCTAYLTCTTAVVDAPSLTKALYDHLVPYFTGAVPLPSKLRINVAGCPSSCGGLAADIVLSGHYGAAPDFDREKIRLCLPARAEVLDRVVPEVQMVCPVNAIRSFPNEDGSVGIEIIAERCIGCGRCKDVCDHVTWNPEKIGVSVLVGGKSSNTGVGPTLARVLVPWIPAHPPEYRETVAVVRKIIDTWRAGAEPGERIADWIHRVGMETVFQQLRVPVGRWNRPVELSTGYGVRQFLPR